LQEKKVDVLIVGAGPAGAACALQLGNSGLSVAIVDKSAFPRDKTCGDALSVDVVNQLDILSPQLAEAIFNFAHKVSSYGVKIVAPNHQHIDIPFFHQGKEKCGFLCTRFDFDNLLVDQVRKISGITLLENCGVRKIETLVDCVKVHSDEGVITATMVIGADGAQSVVAKFLGMTTLERKHHSAGLRVYYENITSFHPDRYIELYFFKEILPGYLWIFPLPDNKANVGVGMLSDSVSKKKINLRETLEKLILTQPVLKERFRDARPLETVKGFGLPLGSKRRKISGDRILLAGDAASLIDPFSGEGIGNAIRSGRVAAEHTLTCFGKKNFSAGFNASYDEEIYRRMWKELKISKTLQLLCRKAWLLNFVVTKANRSPYLQQFLTDALAHPDQKKLLANPLFYYRLLFR
jgi:geranylgeranyl reductase family protein